MASILIRGERYSALSSSALYEADYESLLLTHRAALYPGFHLVRFNTLVESQYGSARADLALIDRRYRAWWVVEVELAHHSLANHVLPQVRTLALGTYGSQHAEALVRNAVDCEPGRLREMIRGAQPRVLVLVNEPMPEWTPALRAFDARIGIIEVFRSERDVEALRVNGEHPEVPERLLSRCKVDPLMPTALRVESPAALEVRNGETIVLAYGSGVSDWRRVDVADAVWLVPLRRYPLDPRLRTYVIVDDGAEVPTIEPDFGAI